MVTATEMGRTLNRCEHVTVEPTGCECKQDSTAADLHDAEQRWRSRHESPERHRGHRGGCEHEYQCIRLSNASHAVRGTTHPAQPDS